MSILDRVVNRLFNPNEVEVPYKNLQEFFLMLAIEEFNDANLCKLKGALGPPKSGMNVIDNKVVPIVFPHKLIALCREKWADNRRQYFFRGTITENRAWLRSFPNVMESGRGRNIRLKYTFDLDYYERLAETKFSLSPVGDCDWSYRFFESIMCGAIPILGDDDRDKFSCNFRYLRASDAHVYDSSIVEYNIRQLYRYHVIESYFACKETQVSFLGLEG